MPQRKPGSRDAGLFLHGVYRALLEYERARYERRGRESVVIDGQEVGRKSPAGVDGNGQERFFFHSRHRLDEIEAAVLAGESVVVGRGWLELALWDHDRNRDSSAPRPRLPFGRAVRLGRVLPDDRVFPLADTEADGAGLRTFERSKEIAMLPRLRPRLRSE